MCFVVFYATASHFLLNNIKTCKYFLQRLSLSFSLSFSLSLSIYLYMYLTICLFSYLSIHPPISYVSLCHFSSILLFCLCLITLRSPLSLSLSLSLFFSFSLYCDIAKLVKTDFEMIQERSDHICWRLQIVTACKETLI